MNRDDVKAAMRRIRAARLKPAEETEQPRRKLKYTSRVRRGFAAIYEIVVASFDASKPPADTIVKRWKASKMKDFNTALDWMDQEGKSDE